jgi:hypothetical protein
MGRWNHGTCLLLASALIGAGSCAALSCRPIPVEVARKEARARVENRSQGLYRTTETGRLEPVVNPEIVREYWVQSREGDWYRVPADRFEAVQVGQRIEVCR